MTGWGVGYGFKAVSYLGMADAYLSIFENQDVYGHTSWFQINNINSFYLTEFNTADKSRTITKTGFGAVYEGACKHLVGKRLKQSGIIWSRAGSSSDIGLAGCLPE